MVGHNFFQANNFELVGANIFLKNHLAGNYYIQWSIPGKQKHSRYLFFSVVYFNISQNSKTNFIEQNWSLNEKAKKQLHNEWSI